jgi:hypothetical protein
MIKNRKRKIVEEEPYEENKKYKRTDDNHVIIYLNPDKIKANIDLDHIFLDVKQTEERIKSIELKMIGNSTKQWKIYQTMFLNLFYFCESFKSITRIDLDIPFSMNYAFEIARYLTYNHRITEFKLMFRNPANDTMNNNENFKFYNERSYKTMNNIFKKLINYNKLNDEKRIKMLILLIQKDKNCTWNNIKNYGNGGIKILTKIPKCVITHMMDFIDKSDDEKKKEKEMSILANLDYQLLSSITTTNKSNFFLRPK